MFETNFGFERLAESGCASAIDAETSETFKAWVLTLRNRADLVPTELSDEAWGSLVFEKPGRISSGTGKVRGAPKPGDRH